MCYLEDVIIKLFFIFTKILKFYVFDWVVTNQPVYLYLYHCYFVITQWKLFCCSVSQSPYSTWLLTRSFLLIADLLIGLWRHLLDLRFKQNHVEYLYPHWTSGWVLSFYLWSPSDERFLGNTQRKYFWVCRNAFVQKCLLCLWPAIERV